MVANIQMTDVNSFSQVTVLPRGGRGLLAGSTLVEIHEVGILSLTWPLAHLRLSTPAQISSFASTEINIQLFKSL